MSKCFYEKRTLKRTFRDVSFAVQWSTSPCVEVERPSYKVGFDVYTVKTSVLFSTYYYPFKKESILLPLAYKVMNPDLSRSKKNSQNKQKKCSGQNSDFINPCALSLAKFSQEKFDQA